MTSAEIANQVAMGQQMHAAVSSHGDWLSSTMKSAVDPQMGASYLSGKTMNQGAAIAAPIAGLVTGGLAMESGMAGFGVARRLGMGYMAAGGVGLGAFGVVSAGLAAGSWAVNQAHMGAQQQQQFIQGMQRSFNFQTPSGSGFTNNQLNSIGSNLRSMSGQIGPMGQMVGFEELSSLAQNMGRMGQMTGSQDVTSFTQNFRKMLQTVKQVATELGTSLTEAQNMMSGMRSTGIFSSTDQMRMASQMRSYSIAGNMGVSELTQAAGFGSQISRAVGGLGRQGAFAGMKTLGEIGIAVQAGVISDEDIYNTTGLRGAEGRQALAQSQLQSSAGWLRSGRGRRFLASIASADGTLDRSSVDAWNSGDMGIGNTMGQSRKNLAGVGAANFLRNEGRLRGAALEQFGGNLQAMALSQWMDSKGYSIDGMDDRTMLFAQRQLGMGRDEADTAFKILQGMPKIREEARRSAQTDTYRQEMASYRRTTGLEGARRKVEATREHVQNKLQSVGQQMYSDLTDYIDDWLQKKTGAIMEQASKDIDRTYEDLLKGSNSRGVQTRFGVGQPKSGQVRLEGDPAGMVRGAGMTAKAFEKGVFGLGSMKSTLTEQGFSGLVKRLPGETLQDAEVGGILSGASALYRGASLGNDTEAAALGMASRAKLQELYTSKAAGLKGTDRIDAVREALLGGSESDKKLANMLLYNRSDAKSIERASNALASAEGDKGAGIAEAARLSSQERIPGLDIAAGAGRGMSTRDRMASYYSGNNKERGGYLKEFARNMIGSNEIEEKIVGGEKKFEALGTAARFVSGVQLFNPLLMPFRIARALKGLGDSADTSRGVQDEGQFRISDEGLQYSSDILGGTNRGDDLNKQIQSLESVKDKDALVKERLRMFRGMKSLNDRIQEDKKAGRNTVLDPEKDGELFAVASSMTRSLEEQQAINRRVALQTRGMGAQSALTNLGQVGVLDKDGNISGSLLNKLKGMGGESTYAQMIAKQKLEARGARGDLSDAGSLSTLRELQGSGAAQEESLLNMSVSDLRRQAGAIRGAGDFGNADLFSDMAGRKSRMAAYTSRGGILGGLKALGMNVSREDARVLANAGAGSGKIQQYLANKLGISGPTEADINKQMNEVEMDFMNMSEEERSAKLKELEGMRAGAQKNDRLRELTKGVDSAKTKEERDKALLRLESSPEYREYKEKQAVENNPQVKFLSEIAKNTAEMKTAIDGLKTVIGESSLGGGGKAPQPGKPKGK